MKSLAAALPALCLVLLSTSLYAQHSDVEFGYDDTGTPTAFDIEAVESTLEGFLFFEAEFEELDPFTPGDFSSDEPGFATNHTEGLLVNAGDQIFINVVDASTVSTFGVGYVNYYNPLTDALEASGRLAMQDNSAATADLVLNGGSIESGLSPQFLGVADGDGEVHDHVVMDLLDDATAPTGAYGVLIELQSDFGGLDGTMDLTSDPFWIVWNHGMSEEDFETLAVPKFGIASVPEPTTFGLLGLGVGVACLRRRRRI